MPFSRGCLGGKVKDLMCSLSTLCLHSVRRDSASQCCFSQERSPVDQCYVLFYEMTSLIELFFVKYTVQASQQIRLFIFPSWKSTWKLPKSALCDVCLITLFLHLACRLLGETWVRELPWGVKSGHRVGGRGLCTYITHQFTSQCPGISEKALNNALRTCMHGLDMTSSVYVLPAGQRVVYTILQFERFLEEGAPPSLLLCLDKNLVRTWESIMHNEGKEKRSQWKGKSLIDILACNEDLHRFHICTKQ